MIKKTVKKLVGLKKEEFDEFVKEGQIIVQPSRLIPTHKTGDEMALTSIFLSTLRLVKEYRNDLFKEIKFPKSGKAYYYTEASFPDINKRRIDGLIIVVSKGVITDAVFFEMKNKSNQIDKEQIEAYIDISKQLKVTKLVTVSNEFVPSPTDSPIEVKVPKSISLFHFSWTYLMTMGQILLFKNDHNIEDEDQVEIMSETLHYFENPVSGTAGYTQMSGGWKAVSEAIRAQQPLKQSDDLVAEAVNSWYQEEKDMALLLSRKLGVLVKTDTKSKESLKKDVKRLVQDNYVSSSLSVKGAVSDVKVIAEFERRNVSMDVKLIPPLDKGNKAKITWIGKQLENCKKKAPELFDSLYKDIWIEVNIKFARENIKLKLSDLDQLTELIVGKDIQAFHVVLIQGFGAGFASNKKFVSLIEAMVLDYYEAIVQHVSTWNRPAPKLVND